MCSLTGRVSRALLWVTVPMLVASASFGQAPREWTHLEIVDVNAHPWDETPRFAARSKTFFKTPDDGGLIYAEFAPTWSVAPARDPLGPHYHLFHEWAYLLSGDFVIHEPVSPDQQHGAVYRFVEGTWLDRPAYTLHGGDWETGGLRPQNASRLLIMEEGDGSVITLGPDGDHFKPDFPDSRPDPYDPDWQKVDRFPRPWIVDSASVLEWENDPNLKGRLVKWLSDDGDGFRARMIKIPPGWSAPAGTKNHYFTKAHRLRYVLYGDLRVLAFSDPDEQGKSTQAGSDFFIYQPPNSLWGWGDEPITKDGAVWLEVTYSAGLKVGGGPIEEPTQVP